MEKSDKGSDAGPSKPKPMTRIKPTLSSMPDLQLHSPSNIIGTPYTHSNVPYEYPFPRTPSLSSDALTPPLLSSFSLSAPTVALSTSPPFGPTLDARVFSPTHPKLRNVDPPVPPTLAKKRQRWSLTLKRRGSSESSTAAKSVGTGPESPRSFSLDDNSPRLGDPRTILAAHGQASSSGKPSPRSEAGGH